MPVHDPYELAPGDIKEPPTSFVQSVKYLGPGFILSASIVGSGELIATTIMGAKAGFVLLWFIIFSCIIKVAVQLEFGKVAISSGETTMEALNSLPGPRLGSANWSIWMWLILMLTKMLQLGGIIGAVVLGFEQLAPGLGTANLVSTESVTIPARLLTTLMIGVSVSVLVYRGYYVLLEKASLIMIGLFTVFTLLSLIMLQTTDMAVTGSELASGMVPSWPSQAVLLVAIGAFGITGVGGDEILAYNYWLIEKGYTSYTGPKDNSPQWERRAKGWIRVMNYDAFASMAIYTLSTAAFFVMGAAVLHADGRNPDNHRLVSTLAESYVPVFGDYGRLLLLGGAIAVLYSTYMVANASNSRVFADFTGVIGLSDKRLESTQRQFLIGVLSFCLPLACVLVYLVVKAPVLLIMISGMCQSLLLPVLGFSSLYFRYRETDNRLSPGRLWDLALVTSCFGMLVAGSWGIYKVLTNV